MTPRSPICSVVIPSYNHASFIRSAIDSVLTQTVAELEVIVVDDCSDDGSPAVIRSFADPRIRTVFLPKNVGGSAALNIGIDLASAPYVAICNSDDTWVTDKLERQLAIFEDLPEVSAVFSDVQWIDENGQPAVVPYQLIFTQPNRSRAAWLAHLAEDGNCLCHPSILIKRSVYKDVGLYNEWLRQLPDLEMWLRLLRHHDIFVSAEKLVNFRWHRNNTSRPAADVSLRSFREHVAILTNFFRTADPLVLRDAFGFKTAVQGVGPAARLEVIDYLLNADGVLLENTLRQVGVSLLVELTSDSKIDKATVNAAISPSSFWAMAGGTAIAPSDAMTLSRGRPVDEIRTIDLVRVIFGRVKRRLGL